MPNFDAVATITIAAPPEKIWAALTDPATIKQYFFGTDVATTWRVGSPITWSGEYEGKTYQDHGEIVEFAPPSRLQVTHFSPLSGLPDAPENYHRVSYDLVPEGGATRVTLTQDNNPNEAASEHSKANWLLMLEGLKAATESNP